MHTSDYITSLFKSFLSLPMASQVKLNVLCMAFTDGQDLALLHLHFLLWSFKHQLKARQFLGPASSGACTLSLSILLQAANRLKQWRKQSSLRVFSTWKTTLYGGWGLRQRFSEKRELWEPGKVLMKAMATERKTQKNYSYKGRIKRF